MACEAVHLRERVETKVKVGGGAGAGTSKSNAFSNSARENNPLSDRYTDLERILNRS